MLHEHHDVPNHLQCDCYFNSFFRPTKKKHRSRALLNSSSIVYKVVVSDTAEPLKHIWLYPAIRPCSPQLPTMTVTNDTYFVLELKTGMLRQTCVHLGLLCWILNIQHIICWFHTGRLRLSNLQSLGQHKWCCRGVGSQISQLDQECDPVRLTPIEVLYLASFCTLESEFEKHEVALLMIAQYKILWSFGHKYLSSVF